MISDIRLGIIGGNGWLGNAIAQAVIGSGLIPPAHLTLSGRSEIAAEAKIAGSAWTRDNQELVDRSNVVVLSVRPDQFGAVKVDARGKLVLSVMASVPAKVIAAQTGAADIARAIPNAAAAIRQSFTPWYALPSVSAEDKTIVQQIFACCGEAAEVSRESDIDYCVGLTGSGAAFPALLAEAMIAHAVAQGLPPAIARRAARSVVTGASQLFAADDCDTKDIVQAMIDYRGTTAAALETMLQRGFKEAVAAGLDAAAVKAASMAQAGG